MRFIVIFMIFFSWALNANANLYQSNKDWTDQFLKFKSTAHIPGADIKSSADKEPNDSIQNHLSSSSSPVNVVQVENKKVDETDKKSEFKKFGNGKTVRKEIESKKNILFSQENICEVPENKKEKLISARNISIEHRTISANKNKLAHSVSLSDKSKKVADKKEPVEAYIKEDKVEFTEKKETVKKSNNDEKNESASLKKSPKHNNLSADQIMNEKISVEVPAGDVFTIVSKLMPSDWRVMLSVKNNKLLNKKFYFVTTKSRGEALNDLSESVGIKFHYFFDLKDENKNTSPLLIVSDN